MSIKPKILKKGKDEFTIFHMRIQNESEEEIIGNIQYHIKMPNGKIEEIKIKRKEVIQAHSELNRQDAYYLPQEAPIGRYQVEGRFYWGNQNILSDTNKTDFFDLEE